MVSYLAQAPEGSLCELQRTARRSMRCLEPLGRGRTPGWRVVRAILSTSASDSAEARRNWRNLDRSFCDAPRLALDAAMVLVS